MKLGGHEYVTTGRYDMKLGRLGHETMTRIIG